MADLWTPLDPHNNIFVMSEPDEVSDNISMPKTAIATISSWLGSPVTMVDEVKLARFNSLPSYSG